LMDDGKQLLSDKYTSENSKVIPPCYIGDGVVLKNATVGPFVSIGNETTLENCTVKNSIIQTQSVIKNATLDNAMIGNHVMYDGNFTQISIGDYSELK